MGRYRQFLPVAATSCHALPRPSPHEVPTPAWLCGMKRRLFATVETLPSKRYRACYKHEGRTVCAQRIFATKADAAPG